MDFDQYENAVIKYHSTLDTSVLPLHSWPFHYDFLNIIKAVFKDSNTLNQFASVYKWDGIVWNFRDKLKEEVIIVTDAHLTIVFASQNITEMNGYNEAEVVGKTPRMFQGPDTNLIVSKEISTAIKNKKAFEKKVLNYKKNGESYQCLIKGFPIFNSKGHFSHFIAFEKVA